MHERRRGTRRLLALAVVAWLATACAVPGASGTPASLVAGWPRRRCPRPTRGAVRVRAPAVRSGPRRRRPRPSRPGWFARATRSSPWPSALETTPESLAYWNRARYPSLDPDSPAYRPDRIEVGWQLAYLPGAVVDPENLPPASGAPAGPGPRPRPAPSRRSRRTGGRHWSPGARRASTQSPSRSSTRAAPVPGRAARPRSSSGSPRTASRPRSSWRRPRLPTRTERRSWPASVRPAPRPQAR